jgi:hypothetical protein
VDGRNRSLASVAIDHVILDGNMAVRNGITGCSIDYLSCADLQVWEVYGFSLTNSVVMNTPVDSGASVGYAIYLFDTDHPTVTDNLIFNNGVNPYLPPAPHVRLPPYARNVNGFEVDARSRSIWSLRVQRNDVLDNSDGGLCFRAEGGFTITGDVSNNYVAQVFNMNSSAILLYTGNIDNERKLSWFGNGAKSNGDENFLVHDNVINCDAGGHNIRYCSFGINLGFQPWADQTMPVPGDQRFHSNGGAVSRNHVFNARMGINVDGFGQFVGDASNNGWTVVDGNWVGGLTQPQFAYNKAQERAGIQTSDIVAGGRVQVVDPLNGWQVWGQGPAGGFSGNGVPPAWGAFDTSVGGCPIGMCAGFPEP